MEQLNELTNPEISIIIPTFNRGELLGETLDSIRNQTFKNWECLVIDDGSRDYTSELLKFYLKKDPRFKYHQRPLSRRKGANSCRNYGFELSKGKYINFFDSDDLMHPDKLKKQLDILKKTGYDFCICQSAVFENNTNGNLPLRFSNIWSDDTFFDFLITKIGWLTQAPLWKRSFLDQGYLFDEDLHAAQEWEFHLRKLYSSPAYATIDEVLVYLRKHHETISYKKGEEFREWNYFLARLKIYQNEHLTLKEKELDFLKDYLLKVFKRMIIRNSEFKWKAWRSYVLQNQEFSISAKLNAIFALVSFHNFGKGNIFLQNIKT